MFDWYSAALSNRRIKKNTLIETLMDKSYHNKNQRQLAKICAEYNIVPEKELATKNYSDSVSKVNMISG